MLIDITKTIETETGHRLLDYEGKCAHLHGHRYVWEVTVTAKELDETGFVIDFSVLKQILKATIGKYDHSFIFNQEDPLLQLIKKLQRKAIGFDKKSIDEIFAGTDGSPTRIQIVPFNPTVENLLLHTVQILIVMLDQRGLELVKLVVHETSTSKAEWNRSKAEWNRSNTRGF